MSNLNWSPEANRAHDEAAINYRIRLHQIEQHERGAYYDETHQMLCVPSYVYDRIITPRAAKIWKDRGLKWNPAKHEWHMRVSPADAPEQLRITRQLFDELWNTHTAQQNSDSQKEAK